ncbi:MAG: DUF417 family protein [Gemmatimonadaceae bacterium]
MATTVNRTDHKSRADISRSGLESVGARVLRYGLAMVLIWIGALKFAAYEAKGVADLVAESPLMSWMLSIMSGASAARLIGCVEILLGLMIASRAFAPRISALGSLGAIGVFLITLTLLLSTPGVWQPGYGFPFLSPMPGGFLAKDLIFLGAAIWTAGEAMRAADARRVHT